MDSEALDLLSAPKFTYYFTHRSNSLLKLNLTNQSTQEPEETFDLQIFSHKLVYQDLYKFEFVLTFDNNLHEICKNYYYEIVLKVSQSIDKKSQVQTLFSIAKNRNTDEIKGKGIFQLNLDSAHVHHYILYIRRFKDTNGTKVKKEKDNVGTMLWKTGVYSDISLIVGDKIFRVHKEVLSQKSEVFKKMFAHEMIESQNGIVKIDDLEAEVVEEMLSYVYTGIAGNIAKIPRELFEASHRYQLHELQSLCEEHIVFSLNYDNAVDILEIASLYDLEELRKSIMSFVKNHEEEMIEEPSFQSFLCRGLKTNSAVETLLLPDRYKLDDVKREALKFIKEHDKEMMERGEFLELFTTQPDLMREVFKYIYEKVAELHSSD